MFAKSVTKRYFKLLQIKICLCLLQSLALFCEHENVQFKYRENVLRKLIFAETFTRDFYAEIFLPFLYENINISHMYDRLEMSLEKL